MDSKVVVKKSALDYFRQKARKSQFEIHAYLIGLYVHPNKFIISSIEHAREYEVQTKDCVQPAGKEFVRVKALADSQGKRVIGDLHSHPDYEAVMSPADHKACLEDGLQLCGIVSVIKGKTKVRFWTVNSALSCDIKYA